MAKKFTVNIGDKVAYSIQFLASIGMSHSDMAGARGVVVEISTIGDRLLVAKIDWQNPDMPEKIAIFNLAKVGLN
jgi:hypothetical protein